MSRGFLLLLCVNAILSMANDTKRNCFADVNRPLGIAYGALFLVSARVPPHTHIAVGALDGQESC